MKFLAGAFLLQLGWKNEPRTQVWWTTYTGLMDVIHRFSCPIGDPFSGQKKFFEAWKGVRKVTTGIAGSLHCEAEFTKRWIVHPLISWVVLPTYAYSTLSNGSAPFFYFFLFTRARAQAQALKHSSAMRDAGQAKKSNQSPQKVLVDIDSRTGDAAWTARASEPCKSELAKECVNHLCSSVQ